MPADWTDFLPAAEAARYTLEPSTGSLRLEGPSALVIVDCTLAFTGRSPAQSYEEAAAEFGTVCGPHAWASLAVIRSLSDWFRDTGLPVIYTRSQLSVRAMIGGATRSREVRRRDLEEARRGNEFHELVRPRDGDFVLEKIRASAFFESPLRTILQSWRTTNVVVCGATTSGCVRATVQDAFSHGLETYVPADACFDRSETLHRANLWDMNAKYARVVTAEVLAKALGDR